MSAAETKTNTTAATTQKSSSSSAKSTPTTAKTSPTDDTTKNSTTTSPANLSPADKLERFNKFEDEGVTFKAKLIGSELVIEPRGDKMCQNSIQRLKAIIKGQKVHKKRIVMKISYNGVKVCDEKTSEVLYHHEVPQISFIASDDSDSRTFGYVCDVPNKAHQFVCFKTSGPALQVMSEISLLFEAVLERKKKKDEGQGDEKDKDKEKGDEATAASATNNKARPSASSSSSAATDENANKLSGSMKSNDKENNNDQFGFGDLAQDDFCEPAAQVNKAPFQRQQSKQFADDLKDLNIGGSITRLDDSSRLDLIGSTGTGSNTAGDSGIMDLTFSDWLPSPPPPPPPQAQYHHQTQQAPSQQQHYQQVTTSAAIPIAQPQRPQAFNFTSSSFSGARFGAHMLSSTTPSPGAAAMGASASSMSANRLPGVGGGQNRSLIYNHSSVSLNDAALSSRNNSSGSFQVSPLAATTSNNTHSQGAGFGRQESTDKYAVFNDIDALPSIFESISSLDSSTTKLSSVDQQPHFGGPPPPPQAMPLGSQSMDQRQYQRHHHQHHLSHQQQQQQQQQVSVGSYPSSQQQHQFLNHSQSQFTLSLGSSSQPMQQYQSQQAQQGSVVAGGSMAAAAGVVPRQLSNPFDDDFFA